MREVARRVGRDARSVNADLAAPMNAGGVDMAEADQVVLPCRAVKVGFLLQAA